MATDPVVEWNAGTLLGEGPLWLADERALWFVDIKGHRLHRYVPSTGEKTAFETPSSPGFIDRDLSGTLIVGLADGLYHFHPEARTFALLHRVDPDKPGNRINDGLIDRQGRLWFGTMDDAEQTGTGTLYRLGADGLVAIDSGFIVTNGEAVSPDGRTLYHNDSSNQTIYAYDIASDGTTSNKRIFAKIEPGAGYPDGNAVDAEGCLWVCLWDGWSARRYAPDGRVLATVRFPCARVTKIAFGGPDLRTAYVTTAQWNLTPEQRAAQPLAGALFRFETDVPGL